MFTKRSSYERQLAKRSTPIVLYMFHYYSNPIALQVRLARDGDEGGIRPGRSEPPLVFINQYPSYLRALGCLPVTLVEYPLVHRRFQWPSIPSLDRFFTPDEGCVGHVVRPSLSPPLRTTRPFVNRQTSDTLDSPDEPGLVDI